MLPITDLHWRLDPASLLPEQWASGDEGEDAYIFNPTMCKTQNGYAICYRVVQVNSEERRLATCQLDANMVPIPGSVVALSDEIEFAQVGNLNQRALTWHADPRYFLLDGKIYLSWNDGGAQPRNHQFMQEMDATGTRPTGFAREIVTTRDRRAIEKNWMFFEADNKIWSIYSSFPHDVMSVDLSDPDFVICKPAHVTEGLSDYEALYGVVRGGAQPISMGEHMLVLAHSSYKMNDGLRYYVCMIYEILARPPFSMTRCSAVPFTLPHESGNAAFGLAKLNPTVGSVVYPCGIVHENDNVLISYGINDERAAIAQVPIKAMLETLRPVDQARSTAYSSALLDPTHAPVNEAHTPKLFWWDATQKSFDGNYGQRRFAIGNFGDIASRDIVERVGGVSTRRWVGEGSKLLGVGSIMHNARNGDVIWGSGVKGTQRALHDSIEHLDVRACRGPLSADVLRAHKIDMSKVSHVFDPGVLVSRLWAQDIAAYDPARNDHRGRIRVVPHYRDDIFFRRMYPEYINSFISVDDTPLGMIEKMIGAEAVFSSSLHGIIFAESMGIPAYWLTPHGGEDTMKYYDYYYGTGRYNIKSHDDLRAAIRAPALPLPKFDFDAYLATFPHDRMADLSDNGMAMETDYALGTMKPDAISEIAQVNWADLRSSSNGLIVMSRGGARFRLLISQDVKESAYLSLTVGRTKSSLPSHLRIEVVAMDNVYAQLEWPPHEVADQTCDIFLPKGFNGRFLDISLRCADNRKAQLVLRKAKIKPAPATDWLDETHSEERPRRRETVLEKIRSLFVESKNEWLVNLGDLSETALIRKEMPNSYVRFMPKAELVVPRDLLSSARLIYITGPSASSDRALDTLVCYVDGKPIPVMTTRNGSSKVWSAKCDMKGVRPSGSALARVRFDFLAKEVEGDALVPVDESVLIRKIALAKS